jgi:serine/threonine protein kinase
MPPCRPCGAYADNQTQSYSGSFALKRLNSSSREAFESEVEMLRKFSQNKHKHLISLLLTYEQDYTFYLLFDWAHCNLKDYWQYEQPRPDVTCQKTVLWIGEQCQGIAHGVLFLHDYETNSLNAASQQPVQVFGHHGDIKEENILWFPCDGLQELGEAREPNRGLLKLADFGVARFNPQCTSSLDPNASVHLTPSYRPPESDLLKPRAQGRSYDIWTLGILYLQLATWLLGGWEAIQEFKQKRQSRDPDMYDMTTDIFFERDPASFEDDRRNGQRRFIIKRTVTQVSSFTLPPPFLLVPTPLPLTSVATSSSQSYIVILRARSSSTTCCASSRRR